MVLTLKLCACGDDPTAPPNEWPSTNTSSHWSPTYHESMSGLFSTVEPEYPILIDGIIVVSYAFQADDTLKFSRFLVVSVVPLFSGAFWLYA